MNNIGIIGSHGVGKTTLQKNIIKTLRSLKMPAHGIKDIARLCPFQVGLKSDLNAQEWIIKNQLNIEKLFQYKDSNFIFDGCSLSHLAYYEYWGGETKNFIREVLINMMYFDSILLLPPNKEFLKDDGLRPTQANFQDAIHDIIIGFLNRYKIEYINYDFNSNNELFKLLPSLNLIHQEKLPKQKLVILGLVENENKVLMTRRKDILIPEADGKWDFPGGTVIFKEHPERTLLREVFEETGYLVKIEKLLPTVINNIWNNTAENIQTIVICYKCSLISDIVFTDQSDEDIQEICWINRKDILQLDLIQGIDAFIKIKKSLL